jgi:hypothetical protein
MNPWNRGLNRFGTYTWLAGMYFIHPHTRYCLSKMLGSLALVVDLGVATIAHVLLALLTVDD